MVRNWLLSFFLVISLAAISQVGMDTNRLSDGIKLRDSLYRIQDKVRRGELTALRQIGNFLDDTSFVQEFLGYHNYPTSARVLAARVISENCLFLENEFRLDSTLTKHTFLTLLNSNKVMFDELSTSFLITPIDKRTTRYELKELTPDELLHADTVNSNKIYPGWVYANQIDGLLFSHNPEVLKWIAAIWYSHRSRFNVYHFDDDDFLNLLKKLTRLDLAVPGEDGKMTNLFDDDYYGVAKLNALIYWTTHWKDYSWNDKLGYFENQVEKGVALSTEEKLFKLLFSENDTVAQNAFIALTELDPALVTAKAKEYKGHLSERPNFSLPTFPFRFLEQTVWFTKYCRRHGISYKGPASLQDMLGKLLEELSFKERYALEEQIIRTLTLGDIAAVEYHGLVYGGFWSSTYSVGRILDKYYSYNWKKVAGDKQQISTYLKKSSLFDKIGIIGTVNKYRKKFLGSDMVTIANLEKIIAEEEDSAIIIEAKLVLENYVNKPAINLVSVPKPGKGISGVKNLGSRYREIATSTRKKNDKRWAILQLFAGINYEQLGDALGLMLADTILEDYKRFWILGNDFGIELDSLTPETVREFISFYRSVPKREVYGRYLREKYDRCFDKSGLLIFSEVYDILKYDVVDAFVGGGGGRRDDGIYPLIKLLEIRFGTTLGFPEKLCESEGIYSCGTGDRAIAWMKYLLDKKLVPQDMDPVSISY